MPTAPESAFATWLRRLLGEDPGALAWPRVFAAPGRGREHPALYDPHNALLQLYGVRPAALVAGPLAPALEADCSTEPPCSRVLVFAPTGDEDAWAGLGFVREGEIAVYREDGADAALWARGSGARCAAPPEAAVGTVRPRHDRLPPDWTCRPAHPGDAAAIRALLAAVFSDYPIPSDPGVIRYALAEGGVRGRVVLTPDDEVVAYASLEDQPGDGARELTDCVTRPDHRGRGLMGSLVGALLGDLDGAGAYSLVREDSPAMGRVLARGGWRRTGRLVGHYRVAAGWMSAGVWTAPATRPSG